MVQRSRSFGFRGNSVKNTLLFAWLASGWRVAGGRWMFPGNACRRTEDLNACSTPFDLINVVSVNQWWASVLGKAVGRQPADSHPAHAKKNTGLFRN
jgi:hypothetical protein